MNRFISTNIKSKKVILTLILILFILLLIAFAMYRYTTRSYSEHFNETILIDDSIYGKFKCFKSDKTICESIIKQKSWEKPILDLIFQNYKENTNMLDIGANYGAHSVGLGNEIKKRGGNGKIYAFELQPEIYKLCKENVEMNGLGDIIILHPFGLGDKNENKNFNLPKNYDHNGNPGALSLYNHHSNLDKEQEHKNESVRIQRLDDLNLDGISLIKIDVEGYELEVFEGGKETIIRNKPVILIEIWNHHKDKYVSWIQDHFPFYDIEHISNEDYLLRPREDSHLAESS